MINLDLCQLPAEGKSKLRSLSLVGESLPNGLAVPIGVMNAIEALDARHGVFPNLVMTPILSALWAFKENPTRTIEFLHQAWDLMETTSRRFNAFGKSIDPECKEQIFNIDPLFAQRLKEFNTKTDLWAIFGYQTIFGIVCWMLTGEFRMTKRQIKIFAKSFIKASRFQMNGNDNGFGTVPTSMCAQEGIMHRLCTDSDTDGSGVTTMLRNAILATTNFAGKVDDHLKVMRCFVPLLHNEAYQLAPYGVGQAKFVLARDHDGNGLCHAPELYWKQIGRTISKRLVVNVVTND